MATPLTDTRELIGFYAEDLHEDARLARPNSRLEYLRTRELLRSRLPEAPARVLDVGGGTGVHAAWLADDGYDVTLVDVVPDHVRLTLERPQTFTAQVGDARRLDFRDNSFDACILLGAMYHLPDPETAHRRFGKPHESCEPEDWSAPLRSRAVLGRSTPSVTEPALATSLSGRWPQR